MSKTICSVCNNEITPDQKRGGYYCDDPKAWDWVRGFYHAGPKHRQCGNFGGLIKEWVSLGVKVKNVTEQFQKQFIKNQ